MPDVDGGDKTTESDQELLPNKWKKDIDGAWRMDADISVQEESSDENEIDGEFNESKVKIESDVESSDDKLNSDGDNN